jgi:putative nucleotidyltransferase with HDIG domain
MQRSIYNIIRIVGLYLIFAVLWIILTDILAGILQARYGFPMDVIQTVKGLGFVLVSAMVMFILLNDDLRRREAEYQKHLEEKEQLLQQLRKKNAEMVDAYDRTIFGWSRVLEMRNREVKDHSRRVTEMAMQLARYVGVDGDDLEQIRRGSLLHDIGKMAIPDEIILKDGDLSEEERAIIRRHPLFGFEMVSEIEFLRPAVDIMLCHHEKWDGTGYPFGLAGDQIPLFARIFAVVDVWDALRSDDRTYRKPDPPEVAAEYLRSQAGEHFDPDVVEAFLKMLGEENYTGSSTPSLT